MADDEIYILVVNLSNKSLNSPFLNLSQMGQE